MNNGKSRATLQAVVALYLLYTAWELFQGRNAPDTSMAPQFAVLFAILFFIAAGGILYLAWKSWKRAEQSEESNEKEDNPNSLK